MFNDISLNASLYKSGYTISINNPIETNILTIINYKNEEIIKISSDGEIYYKFNGDMIKVNMPDDLVEAFLQVIISYTGKQPDDVIIDTYIDKISKNKKSEEYITKLEVAIRKLKLEKINNNFFY